MSTSTQYDLPLGLTTPLGKNKVILQDYAGREEISSTFNFQIRILVKKPDDQTIDKAFPFEKILGQPVTISMVIAKDKYRYFNGIISWISQGEIVTSQVGGVDYYRYTLNMVPKVWLLSRTKRSRIFQHKSVLDILKLVLTGIDADYSGVTGKLEPRDYCVQYRETDLDFASRLMEEEGLFYWFKHADGSHKMMLADSSQAHPPIDGNIKVPFLNSSTGSKGGEEILAWERFQEIRSGKYTLWDHNFELPDKNLEATKPILESVAVGAVTQKLKVGGNDAFEIYDYPGGFSERFDGIDKGGGAQASELQKIFKDNARTVALRMQQETIPGLRISGGSNSMRLAAGYKFTLESHFNADGSYLLTQIDHTASIGDALLVGTMPELYYGANFRCIPFALPFRPEQRIEKPTIHGTQTAVVVGNASDEITTDKYGRVKVQFHWDRDGKKNTDSSCWVRVGSIWAGKQWGAIHIPRIGQEVIVAFEEGDPDRPIIIGSVYNAENMPPYTLPDNRSQSGLKSRSTLKGEATNFNELRFEDKKGSEEIYFHAEKDFTRLVENNDKLTVGSKDSKTCPDGSQVISIWKDRTESVETGNELVTIKKGDRTINVDEKNDTHNIKKGNREVNIDKGTDTLNVKTGDRTVNVDKGNVTHSIKGGNRDVTISKGNDTLSITKGNHSTTLSAGASTVDAMKSITLKVGQNSIVVDQKGVTIQGLMVKIQAKMSCQIQSNIIKANGDGFIILKGGTIMIN